MAEANQDEMRSNWTVKNFSDETREAVVAAARQEGISVHAWLDRACQRALLQPAPELLLPGQRAGNDGQTMGQLPDMSWVAAPVAAAVQAREGGFKGLADEIAAMVRRQVRAWQGLPALKGPTRGQRAALPVPTKIIAAAE